MSFNIDSFIFVAFLVVNLVFGLWSSRGIKTIKEYAVGDRKFSTATIAATIIATWIGGGFFSSTLSETYRDGLWHIIARFGDVLTLLIVGYFIAPRVREFLNMISVAEVMGSLYGHKVRIITAISSIALSVGYVAVQIKVTSSLFSHFLGVSGIYAVIFSSLIITIYSAFGGIKAVTFTDIIQFLTFGVFIPIFALFIWNVFDTSTTIGDIFVKNPLFDYREVFNYHDPKFYAFFALFLYFTIPGLDPATFQRILMAKNTVQAQRSFVISAVLCLFVGGMACFIGIILLNHNPNLNPDNLVMYVVDNYSYPGLKGLTLIGMMAMIMSTADSYINSASVIFAHDLCSDSKLKAITNPLIISRIFSLFVGLFATTLALYADSLFELLLLVGNFYTPLITMPLMLAILGYRSTSRVVLFSIFLGGLTVITWRYTFQVQTGIDSIIPGTLVNLISMFVLNYFFGTKLKKQVLVNGLIRHKKKGVFKYFITIFTKRFGLTLPKTDRAYVVFGAFSFMTNLIAVFALNKNIYNQHIYIINTLQILGLMVSTIFICQTVWKNFWTKKGTAVFWYVSIFINLSYVNCFLLLISDISQVNLVIFILNLSTICILLNWEIALALIIVGCTSAFFSYRFCLEEGLVSGLYKSELQIIYILFMLGIFMLAFLKPKQDYQELTEERNKHLKGRIVAKDKEVQEALALKGEFIRNVQHEYHTPMTGIISLSEGLLYAYDQLTDEEKREYLKDIVQNSHKLQTFDENITTLSLLSKPHYKLEREDIALNDLIYERVQICRKLYDQDNDDREFILDLEDNIVVSADKSYIIQLLDNLLINAIQYCKKGLIRVTLSTDRINAVITVLDEGIGIPKLELFEIFDPFTVSSKTRTPSGGRGVGLAVCRRIAEVHGGEITAESDGKKGAKFTVKLPLHKR